jgi:hypothetical protein
MSHARALMAVTVAGAVFVSSGSSCNAAHFFDRAVKDTAQAMSEMWFHG